MAKSDDFKEGSSHPFDDFQIGDQVEHAKFGTGTILFRSGSGESSKVIVVFSEEGQKKLALKYAKLKKISEGKSRVQEQPVPVAAKPAKVVVDDFEHVEIDEDLEEEVAIAGVEEEGLPLPVDETDIAFGEDEEEIPFAEEEDEEP